MTNRLPALGDEVRNRITGFTGIVTSYSKHLAGCDRLWVEPRVDATGKPMEGAWLDIDLAEITRPNVIDPIRYNRSAPGGIDLPAPR